MCVKKDPKACRHNELEDGAACQQAGHLDVFGFDITVHYVTLRYVTLHVIILITWY